MNNPPFSVSTIAKTNDFANHLAYFQCDGIRQTGWLPYHQLRLPVDDLGFRQGVTAVERLRTYDGRPFLVAQHLARFHNSVQLVQIHHVAAVHQCQSWIEEILSRNVSLLESHGDVGITIWATPGNCGNSRPTIAVHLNPMDPTALKNRRATGQSVMLTDVVQPDVGCWSRQAKVRSRLHYYLADQAARTAAATGVLQDTDGTWTESSVANIAIVADGEIVVAPSERVLPGITQAYVGELANGQGIPSREAPLSTQMIVNADALLLMGTDTGLWFAERVLDAHGNLLRQYETPAAEGVYRQLQSLMPLSARDM